MHKTVIMPCLTLLLLFLIPIVRADEVLIKIATMAPEGTIWMVELNKLNDDLQKRTKGEVKLRIYAGGVAGEERSVVKQIQLGKLDGAFFAGSGLGEILSHIRVLELPFYYKNHDEWKFVADKLSPKFDKEFEDKGYKLLGWTEGGFAYLFSGNPIRNLDEFRSSKVWFYEGDAMIESCFKELNATGVPMGVTDVVTSLQTGKVNCVYCPPCALTALRWHTHVKHYTDLPIVKILGGLIITKKAFNKVPKQYQKTLSDLSKKYMRQLQQKSTMANDDTLKELREKFGVASATPENSLIEETKVFSQKVADGQVNVLYSAALFDEAKALLAEYRKNNGPK